MCCNCKQSMYTQVEVQTQIIPDQNVPGKIYRWSGQFPDFCAFEDFSRGCNLSAQCNLLIKTKFLDSQKTNNILLKSQTFRNARNLQLKKKGKWNLRNCFLHSHSEIYWLSDLDLWCRWSSLFWIILKTPPLCNRTGVNQYGQVQICSCKSCHFLGSSDLDQVWFFNLNIFTSDRSLFSSLSCASMASSCSLFLLLSRVCALCTWLRLLTSSSFPSISSHLRPISAFLK